MSAFKSALYIYDRKNVFQLSIVSITVVLERLIDISNNPYNQFVFIRNSDSTINIYTNESKLVRLPADNRRNDDYRYIFTTELRPTWALFEIYTPSYDLLYLASFVVLQGIESIRGRPSFPYADESIIQINQDYMSPIIAGVCAFIVILFMVIGIYHKQKC